MSGYTMMEKSNSTLDVAVPAEEPLRISTAASSFLSAAQFKYDVLSSLPLLLADFAVTLLALACAQRLLLSENLNSWAIVSVALWTCLTQHIHGLYPACGLSHTLEFRRILRTSLIVSCGLGIVLIARGNFSSPSLLTLAADVVFLTLGLSLIRAIVRFSLRNRDWWCQPVLIVGSGAAAEAKYEKLLRNRTEGLRPVGIVFLPEQFWNSPNGNHSWYLGPLSDLEAVLVGTSTSRIIVAECDVHHKLSVDAYCNIPHVSVRTSLRTFPTEKTRLTDVDGHIELNCVHSIQSCVSQTAKRILDLGLMLLCSPLLVPVLSVIAVLVRLSSPGPIFYSQERIGRNGRFFRAWKFRSMVMNADEMLEKYLLQHPELRAEWDRDHKLKNDPRITFIGKFLRKTSLDELPQLWNVLVGEMSLVGPRPIVQAEIRKYGDVFELYKLVRPGITGLWQVSGRNNTTYQERLELDRRYVQNWSFMLDVYILYRTIRTAIMQEGAY